MLIIYLIISYLSLIGLKSVANPIERNSLNKIVAFKSVQSSDSQTTKNPKLRNKKLLEQISEVSPKTNDHIVKYLSLNPEVNSLPNTLHLKIIRRHVNDSNIKNLQEGLMINRIGIRVPRNNVIIVCNGSTSTTIPSQQLISKTTSECPSSKPTLRNITNCTSIPTRQNLRSTRSPSTLLTFDMFCDTHKTGLSSASVPLQTIQKEESSTAKVSTSCKENATFSILNPFRRLFNCRNKTSTIKTSDNKTTVTSELSKTSIGPETMKELNTKKSNETADFEENEDECETTNHIETTIQSQQSKSIQSGKISNQIETTTQSQLFKSTQSGKMKTCAPTTEFQITKYATEIYETVNLFNGTRKSEKPYIDVSYIKTMNPTDNPHWFSPPKPCDLRPRPFLPFDLEIETITSTAIPTSNQPIMKKFICNLRKTTSSQYSTRIRNKNKLKSFTSGTVVYDNRVHLHIAKVFPTKLYVPFDVQMGRKQKSKIGQRSLKKYFSKNNLKV